MDGDSGLVSRKKHGKFDLATLNNEKIYLIKILSPVKIWACKIICWNPPVTVSLLEINKFFHKYAQAYASIYVSTSKRYLKQSCVANKCFP